MAFFPSTQPAMHLEEDFPLVAAYIRTLTSEPAPPPSTMDTADSSFSSIPEDHQPSTETGDEPMMPDADLSANDLNSLMAERLSEEQTNVLMGKFGEIMRQCEEDGINRDEELKRRKFKSETGKDIFVPLDASSVCAYSYSFISSLSIYFSPPPFLSSSFSFLISGRGVYL